MKSLRRVLVVHPFGIGDLLFVTPVLRALRLVPTVEKVDLLLGSRTEAVVKNNPHVDEIFSIDKDRFHNQSSLKTFQEVFTLGQKLRQKKYDLLLDYSISSQYGFWASTFLNIPRRAGYDYKRRGFFHNICLPLPEGFKDRHVVDSVCDLAELAGIPVQDRFLEFYPPSQKDEFSEALAKEGPEGNPNLAVGFKRYLVVSPGGGESWGKDAHFKQWPVPNFAQLVKRLAAALELEGVVILGSSGEKKLSEDLKRLLSIPSIDLTGEISLNHAAALIQGAELFTGNDGGLVHLAHALRTPVIAFYGPVDPNVYGPYPASPQAIALFKEDLSCRPCYKKFRYNSACPGRECLQDFTPDDAWALLEQKQFFSAFTNA